MVILDYHTWAEKEAGAAGCQPSTNIATLTDLTGTNQSLSNTRRTVQVLFYVYLTVFVVMSLTIRALSDNMAAVIANLP